MERVRRYWQPDEGWVSAELGAIQRPARIASDGRASPQAMDGPVRGPEEIVPPRLSDDAEPAASDRRARLADLRRAIVLSEVIGPHRAGRGEGMHW